MDEVSPSTSNVTENTKPSEPSKQAACLSCRRSKTRCLRDAGDPVCKRCVQAKSECIIPEYRVGRKKGIKNKRDGLDKAVHRIEQAIKKSRSQSSHSDDDFNTFRLQNLLTEAKALVPKYQGDTLAVVPEHPIVPHSQPSQHDNSMMALPPIDPNLLEENFAVDDAENPLQLLARASDLSDPTQQSHASHIGSGAPHLLGPNMGANQGLHSFFGPFRPTIDNHEDLDPIIMGLVTFEESEMLFAYFYQNLSHTRWGLDPLVHTPGFVRKQSLFLFTSILVASSLFLQSTGALSKRLSVHCRYLARLVVANKHRSPEIVLAFMVNIPWMAPGNHWSDDDTPVYMAMALTISLEISLNKIIIPSPSDGSGIPLGVGQSDCVPARKALDLDGFFDVDPTSPLGRRLLRRRERVWLALFVLDRGVCLARGRNFTVPLTPLIESCDSWHTSEVSDVWDESIISSAVLRRDLWQLISDVKKTCDIDSQVTAAILQEMIEGFFNRWYATWAFAIRGSGGNSIPPYVEILVTHGRLSIYGSVINHPTAPAEVKRFFRAAGLSSALNVMRAAVQGENRLKSMPNNTVIMISFAAILSFRLSTMDTASNNNLAPSIRILIEETAGVLERIGSNPPHRNGTSTLYGRHLREVFLASQPQLQHNNAPQHSSSITHAQIHGQNYHNSLSPIQMSELMQFSTMSDDQITQAIHNVGDELGSYVPDFQIDERSGLDWLDWFNIEANGHLG